MVPLFLTALVPRREKRQEGRPLLEVLGSLTWVQWGHFWCGWLAWMCDAVDFVSVSLSITALEQQFKRSTHDITTAITLTLLLRSVGAVIFGILGDRYGRKWPLVGNLVLIAVLELGAGFVQTFEQFLAVRSLFGIGMGGVWGIASSMSLENLPVEARGIASGVFHQGYGVGQLIAAVINLYLVPSVSAGWRALFWTASGISFFAAFTCLLLPESEIFLRAKAASSSTPAKEKTEIFLRQAGEVMKKHWFRFVYIILLMTGFNFLGHGSQDLYPTYLRDTKGFTEHDATVATIIENSGAIAGASLSGYVSQYIGRRLTIIIFVLLTGAFIPLWILPTSFSALSAGAFFNQFGISGGLGVTPIQLAEVSPPAFRASFPNIAYQIGNMISSASAQIEATGGEHLRTRIPGKEGDVPDYAKVQGILIGVVASFVILVTILGPENYASRFEKYKTAIEDAGSREGVVPHDVQESSRSDSIRTDEEKV